MGKPVILDLFCGAGGCGEGYSRAGFRVVGVDLDPKPLRHNPHECYQGDALAVLDTLLAGEAWQGYRLGDFAAIHASPPCEDWCQLKALHPHITYPRLIEPVRARLLRTGLVWIIENIPTAPLDYGVKLCGTMFNLRVYRHRWFETSHYVWQPAHPKHVKRTGGGKGQTQRKAAYLAGGFVTVTGNVGRYAGEAMGIDWMTGNELSKAIPPAYTEWLGRQLLAVVKDHAAPIVPNWLRYRPDGRGERG